MENFHCLYDVLLIKMHDTDSIKLLYIIQDYQLLLVTANIVLASVTNFSETVPSTNIKIARGIYLCVGMIMCCNHFINCLSLRHTERCTISQSCSQLSIHLP